MEFARNPDALDHLDAVIGEEPRAISVISVAELLRTAGSVRGTGGRPFFALVKHLLAAMEPVPITVPVARVHARLLVSVPWPPGPTHGAHHLWIAATASAYGWSLATHDHEVFRRIEGLEVIAL